MRSLSCHCDARSLEPFSALTCPTRNFAAGATKLHLMLWAPVGASLPPAFRPKRLWQLKQPRAGLTVRLQLGGPVPGPEPQTAAAETEAASAGHSTQLSAMSCRCEIISASILYRHL